jgi:hypothetical protein
MGGKRRQRRGVIGVVLLATCLFVSGAPAQADTLPEPLRDPAAFAQPPAAATPGFRWWWTTPYDMASFPREIKAAADAGFGLLEIGFNADGWGNEPQRAALQRSVAAARERGVRLDITMGPGWPLNNAAVAPSTGLSQQELDYGRKDVVGPSSYSGAVPPVRSVPPCGPASPFACVSPGSGGKLMAVTAARVLTPGNPAPQPATQTNADLALGQVRAPTVLDPASLIDLTDKVDADGNLTWEVPDGHWIVFGIYERASGQQVMDHLRAASAKALVGEIDKVSLGAAAAQLPGVGGEFFEDSIEISTTMLWTPAMKAEFRQRRGYDLAKYLPLLFVPGFYAVPVPQDAPAPEYDLPDGLGDRVRHDYWQTLDDLYAEHHFAPFEQWARSHAMHYRVQPAYAGTFHVTRAAREAATLGATVDHESRNAGDPMPYSDPVWHFAFDNYRELAGGSHQGGSSDTAIELGATNARDFMVNLGEYKAIMDKAWAAGINRPIIHGLVNQAAGAAWPGSSRFGGLIAESWNPATFPEWKLLKPLAAYWARGNMILRQGQPQVDVAIYRDGYTTWQASFADIGLDVADDGVSPALPGDPLHDADGGRPLDNALGANTPRPFFATGALEQAGFRMEYLDPDGLLDPRAGNGRVLYPQGPSYRALVVDERALPAATARAIERDAHAGLPLVLVGELPNHGTGAADSAGEDREVRAAVQGMLRAPRVARVATQADVLGALQDLGVEPSAAWSRPVPVYSQHRHTPTADYFYVFNAGRQTEAFTATLRTSGSGRQLNLWTGAVEALPVYRGAGDDRIRVPLKLAPGETQVIAFDRTATRRHAVAVSGGEVADGPDGLEVRDTRGGSREVTLDDGTIARVELPDLPAVLTPSHWHLHVAESNPGGDAAKDVDLDALADWRDISALSGSSGTGTYTTTIDVPADRVGPDRGSYLQLGRVEGAVQVYVNSERVTPAVIAPPRIDLGGRLRPGKNELRIVLATTLKNRLTALARQGQFSLPGALPATQPYGILGPVSIVPYGRAPIALAQPAASSVTAPPAADTTTSSSVPRKPCKPQRRLVVRLPATRRFRVKSVRVVVAGKARKAKLMRRARELVVTVTLKGRLPSRAVPVVTVVRGRHGSVLRDRRIHRPCRSRA